MEGFSTPNDMVISDPKELFQHALQLFHDSCLAMGIGLLEKDNQFQGQGGLVPPFHATMDIGAKLHLCIGIVRVLAGRV